MRQILLQLEKIFPLLRNTTLPALLFGLSLLGFYACQPLATPNLLNLHHLFYAFALLSFLLLLYFNRSKPAFFILNLVLAYILVNLLKRQLGADYYFSSAAYQNLCLFLPLNLGLFYALPEQKLITRRSVYLLLLIFAEYTIAEHLSRHGIHLGTSLNLSPLSGLNTLNLLLFSIILISQFITCSVSGKILDTSLFFATFCTCLGLYYSSSPTALSLFFSGASLIIFLATIEHIYHTTYKDELTGLSGRNAFMLHSKDFPLKYSLGILLIDDYQRLSQVFGRFGINALVKMITQRLLDAEPESQIYRYNTDEFVVLFRNEDKNHAFTRMENMRRAIACAEFMLRGYNKPIKLTVSGSVSEKKRSDANAVEVLVRAGKSLQKARRFTQNITYKD